MQIRRRCPLRAIVWSFRSLRGVGSASVAGMTQPLRVGIIGVGMMGADHVERLARRTVGAELVAVSDPAPDRAAACASRYPGVLPIGDPLELIADAGVDAVLIASPSQAHEEQVLACLDAGKPTLCEKPLTADPASALRVVERERDLGRHLVTVGFMRRFDPEYAQLRELVVSGRFGRLLLMHNIHRNKAVPTADFGSERIVSDSLVHEVDVARFLFGEEIATIHVIAPHASAYAATGVVDPQIAVLTMVGGGVVTNEVFISSQVGYEVRCEIVCERGTAIAGRPGAGLLTTSVGREAGYWGGLLTEDYRGRFATAYDKEVQAWVDAVATGETVGATAWDGYAATAVAQAGLASLASGQPVAVVL